MRKQLRQQRLLLSFLPGFAPILVYIIIDAVFGETAGLAAGMALGIGEFLFILIREKRVDAFTLVDTILLAAMGALSWAFSDPVFFRLKPAISGGVLALMMIAGSLGPHRLFLPYMQNKMGMGELPEVAVKRMLAMIAGFGFLTLAHSALTAVAALYWSRLAWDFIAGALFWILALVYMAAWTIPALVGMAHQRGISRPPDNSRARQTSRMQGGSRSCLLPESEGSLSADMSGEMLPVRTGNRQGVPFVVPYNSDSRRGKREKKDSPSRSQALADGREGRILDAKAIDLKTRSAGKVGLRGRRTYFVWRDCGTFARSRSF